MPEWTAAQLMLNYDTTFIALTEVDTLSGSNTLVVYNLGNVAVELNVGNYGDAERAEPSWLLPAARVCRPRGGRLPQRPAPLWPVSSLPGLQPLRKRGS